MAKVNIDTTKMSVEDLNSKLVELSQVQSRQLFDHAIKGIENPLQLRSRRKDIARINTELRSRELAGMPADVLAKRDRIKLRRK